MPVTAPTPVNWTPAPPAWTPEYGGKPTIPDPFEAWKKAFDFNKFNLADMYDLGDDINKRSQKDVLDWTNKMLPLADQISRQNQQLGTDWMRSLMPLAKDINQQNQSQLLGFLNQSIPNYNAMNRSSSANTQALLAGQIPQDVKNALAQSAAERGVATGTMGSSNANTALMRALGRTSLDLQSQGEKQFSDSIGRTPMAPLFNIGAQQMPGLTSPTLPGMPASFDVTKLFSSPEDIMNSSWMQSVIANAPDPKAAADEASRKAMELINGLRLGEKNNQIGGKNTSFTPTMWNSYYTAGT